MEIMLTIREALAEDVEGILEIYNGAIARTTATFDLEPQTLEERMKWFSHYGGNYPLIVAVTEEGRVAGYSSLSEFRTKPAYRPTVEVSIYIHDEFQGQGLGNRLMTDILGRARDLNYHTVIAGITADNQISVKMHLKFGFELAGTFREVGYKFDAWHDVLFYQLLL